MIDWTGFAFGKKQPRVLDRIDQKAALAKQERGCRVCGKPCRRGQPTCSKGCGYKARKEKTRPAHRCPICSAEFYPIRHLATWSKYCSLKCARAKQSERLAMVPVECCGCGRGFRRTAGAVKRVQRVFCSRECRAKFFVGDKCAQWRGGHDHNRGPAWRTLAEKIRERDGYACRRCGKTQAENKRRLDVDHIVPWRAFDRVEDANDPYNLASLCATCHRHKTAKIERAFLNGDCLVQWQDENAVRLPPLFAQVKQ